MAARRAREEELEALKRELSLLRNEMAYRMVRAPGRLEMYAREISYDMTHDARFYGIDFAEGWPQALESMDHLSAALPDVFGIEREWRDWVKQTYRSKKLCK
eukprot:jgi/Tetstr1/448640/TSEL_035885.t1